MKVEDLELEKIDTIHIFDAPDLVVGKNKYKRCIIIHFLQKEKEMRVYVDVDIDSIMRVDYDTNDEYCNALLKRFNSKSNKVKIDILETIKLSEEMLDMISNMVKKENMVNIPVNNMAEA